MDTVILDEEYLVLWVFRVNTNHKLILTLVTVPCDLLSLGSIVRIKRGHFLVLEQEISLKVLFELHDELKLFQ